jgi:hypothetical protein
MSIANKQNANSANDANKETKNSVDDSAKAQIKVSAVNCNRMISLTIFVGGYFDLCSTMLRGFETM